MTNSSVRRVLALLKLLPNAEGACAPFQLSSERLWRLLEAD